MMKLKSIVFLAFSILVTFGARAEKITITIKNIRSSKGAILVGVYKDNASFSNDAPFKQLSFSKKGLLKGVLKCTIDLPPGTYGFALLDDENNNEEMDESFFGIPEEGYGFSNYNHSGIFRPSFSDFKFKVFVGKITRVIMNVDYF